MAWNPSPEVAVARDAARRLDDAPMCVVVWITNDGRFGYASYGKTKALCATAKTLCTTLFEATRKWLTKRTVLITTPNPR